MFGRYFNLRFVPLAAIMFSCTLAIRVPAWAQFETRTTTALPGASFAVAVGDFNRDGKLDLAVTGDALQIFLGNGDGTFQAPVGYPGVFYGIAVADFNNDGIPDIVVTDDGDSVTVFLGNGDGTFQSPKTSSISAFSLFVVTGDFNGDHKMDIAIVDTPYISILLGNGDGTFQAPSDNASFVGSQEIAVGDFNNDHRLDVAVVGYFGGSTNFGILLGNGDGTLQDSITSPLQYSPGSVSAADLNHDGNMDIAVGYLFEGGCGIFGRREGWLWT